MDKVRSNGMERTDLPLHAVILAPILVAKRCAIDTDRVSVCPTVALVVAKRRKIVAGLRWSAPLSRSRFEAWSKRSFTNESTGTPAQVFAPPTA